MRGKIVYWILIITNKQNEIVLPPRSEVIRQIRFVNIENDIVVRSQEISNNAFIRFLNTTNNIITIKQDNIQTENVSDYEIIIQNSNKREEKDSKVISLLKKNFAEHFKTTLTKLCTEFSDIFGLETEAISTNNFYEQKLRLKDTQPVYIKNYRIPHSHKQEINN